MRKIFAFLVLLLTSFSFPCDALIKAGIGKADLTPPIGTPSAGYQARKGVGMEGVHDPLLAIALYIDNGEKQIVLCSVDHLGFTYEMVQKIESRIKSYPHLESCELYIGSSHTHSGGGAYLNIPIVGESIAGVYNPKIMEFYVDQTVQAIIEASQSLVPAKIGFGYGQAKALNKYRGVSWPKEVIPCSDVAVIKVTTIEDKPLAVLFNYAVHPTVLKYENLQFSADFVGYARDHLRTLIGSDVQPLYFNGAQGDVNPAIFNEGDRFDACRQLGYSLASTVVEIVSKVETQNDVEIKTEKRPYAFTPQATPFDVVLPIESYQSEMNAIIFNRIHVFITIPGELSTLYDQALKQKGKEWGYAQVSIFGLTNDAHGYIILPESWRKKSFESRLSFGGENYGNFIFDVAFNFLQHGK